MTVFGILLVRSVVVRWRGMRRQIVSAPVLMMRSTSSGDTVVFGDGLDAGLVYVRVDVGATSSADEVGDTVDVACGTTAANDDDVE